MFNSYDMKTTNNLNINACSGGIYKTYPESWFQRFHLKSTMAEILLQEKPRMKVCEPREVFEGRKKTRNCYIANGNLWRNGSYG